MTAPLPALHSPSRRPGRAPGAQRGMAVIAALVVVAAAAIAAAAILERQALLVDTLTIERDRTDAQWILRGGLDWSRIILLNDARRNAVTRNSAVWAQPIVGLEVSTADGQRKAYFSGQIEDEQGKYNIWRLADQGVVRPRELAVLRNLLAALGLQESLARTVAIRVADSQGGPGHRQTMPGLRSPGDLAGLEGISPDIAATLSGYLTVLPQKTPINVNTASAEVLSAGIPGLDLARARDLVGQRDRGQWFNDGADFYQRLGEPGTAHGIPISVRSEWFKVTGQVSIHDTPVTMQALLYRQGDEPPVIQWQGG
ncbi:general secretion pathway protein GspK [Bordetella petrii]|nr:general secretion pathway protein GspK [Bordetella petrii]